MPETNEKYRAWAEIVLKLFKRKIVDLGVYDSGDLFDSLAFTVVQQSGGDISRIEFFYNTYGRFQDMGTGREVWKGNPGDLGFTPKRKRKPWYSKVFWGNMKDLSRIVAEHYGEEASKQIVAAFKQSGLSRDLKSQK
jgi:hypothetical protein